MIPAAIGYFVLVLACSVVFLVAPDAGISDWVLAVPLGASILVGFSLNRPSALWLVLVIPAAMVSVDALWATQVIEPPDNHFVDWTGWSFYFLRIAPVFAALAAVLIIFGLLLRRSNWGGQRRGSRGGAA
jgi:hypothetical protein